MPDVNSVVLNSWTPNAKERLYGMEAKRLPTHSTPMEGLDREREYVVGDWEARHSPDKNLKGGIERFKEGVHGEGLGRAGMIAFVQRQDFIHWYEKVNGWIEELASSPLPKHIAPWAPQDQLIALPSPGTDVSKFESIHERSDRSIIHLRHFWLNLSVH